MSRRNRRALANSKPLDPIALHDMEWAPDMRAVKAARAHLASLTPERRAMLEREWS